MYNRVSLLSQEYKDRLKQDQNRKFIYKILFIVAIAILVISLSTMVCKLLFNNNLNNIKKSIKIEQQKIDELILYENMLQDMNIIKNKVDLIQANDREFLRFVYEVTNLLPEGVRAEEISTLAEKNLCEFTYETNTYAQITSTINMLETSELIKNVQCSDITANDSVIKFTLTVELSKELKLAETSEEATDSTAEETSLTDQAS